MNEVFMNKALERPQPMSNAFDCSSIPSPKVDPLTTFEWWTTQAKSLIEGNFRNKAVQGAFKVRTQKVLLGPRETGCISITGEQTLGRPVLMTGTIIEFEGQRIIASEDPETVIDDLALWLMDKAPRNLHKDIELWGAK